MPRRVLLGFLLLVWAGHVAWTTAQPARTPPPMRSERVKGDLHMLAGEGGNVAVYVTTEGVVLVDDMYHRNHDAILAEVRRITPQPLKYVFNTHQHDDHAGGNARMLPLAEVIAHRNARANLVAKRQPFFEETPGTPIGLPRVTFADEASVFLAGTEVRAVHLGRAHTSGDAVIYFPDLKTVHTGDMFLAVRAGGRRGAGAAQRPAGVPIFVDYAQGGSFLEWSRTLDRMLALDFDTVIPGHGPVSSREDVIRFRRDLETMRDRLVGLIKGGISRDELVGILEKDYGWRSTGCPPSPPTAGCLQYQQVDALIAELKGA